MIDTYAWIKPTNLKDAGALRAATFLAHSLLHQGICSQNSQRIQSFAFGGLVRTGPAGFRFRNLTLHGEFKVSQGEWFEDPSHKGAEEGPLRPLALGPPSFP